MKKTTLCYIQKGQKILMMYRNKKSDDENAGKWIGIGGKLKPGEDPDRCMIREVFEETGYEVRSYKYYGEVLFESDEYESEIMYLYHIRSVKGRLKQCDEGSTKYIGIDEIKNLPMWEGDRLFLDCIFKNRQFDRMKLKYVKDKLVYANADGINLM